MDFRYQRRYEYYSLNMTEEWLIELPWDDNSWIKFYESTCDKFWISLKSEYSELLQQALSAICFIHAYGKQLFQHSPSSTNKYR